MDTYDSWVTQDHPMAEGPRNDNYFDEEYEPECPECGARLPRHATGTATQELVDGPETFDVWACPEGCGEFSKTELI